MADSLPPPLTLAQEGRVLWGFLQREMQIFFSNRVNVLFELAEISFFVIAFGVMGNYITKYSTPELLEHLQGAPDYTSFLVIGHLAALMIWSAAGNVTRMIRSKDFPNLYMAPCSLATLIIGANMWKYLLIVIELLFFLTLSYLLFDVRYHFNAGFVVVVLGGIVLMTGFDLLGAGFKIITKSESDPVNWILGISGMVLSGQFFPVEALPEWVRPVCQLHPQYHINYLARKTMGQGVPLSEVWGQLQGFLLTAGLLLAISYLIFKAGFHRARIEGTLGHQ